ncbi:MAG: type II toxin-antitoxin system YoeB family toxin [Dolichospermum sp.]
MVDTNRLVYAVDDVYVTIISCRYHYIKDLDLM